MLRPAPVWLRRRVLLRRNDCRTHVAGDFQLIVSAAEGGALDFDPAPLQRQRGELAGRRSIAVDGLHPAAGGVEDARVSDFDDGAGRDRLDRRQTGECGRDAEQKGGDRCDQLHGLSPGA